MSDSYLKNVVQLYEKYRVVISVIPRSYLNLRSIVKRTFNGLQQLLDLSLSRNKLEHIPNEAFKGLMALRYVENLKNIGWLS